MDGKDPVRLALEAAIQAQDGIELRCALGHHLLMSGLAGEALACFEAGLALCAADPRALEGAADAAEAMNDGAKASAYRLALSTVRGPAGPAVSATTAPLRLVAVNGESVHTTEDGAGERRTTFADVAGLEDAKARLTRSFVLPSRRPDIASAFGTSIRGGLLLYGPPGCGKTHLARALAGEIGAHFINVSLSDVLDMWFGESERKLHEIFENARRWKPAVLFFDEFDALGQRRTNLKGTPGRGLSNQLLAELDGFGAHNGGVFFLGATNHPWDLDPALRRPGRFDQMLFVPPPDRASREEILRLKLRERPVAVDLELRALSVGTEGYSGADIEAIVNSATELAMEASVKAERTVPIDAAAFRRAAAQIRASTRAWFDVSRNYALFANEGGTYDELLSYLRARGLV